MTVSVTVPPSSVARARHFETQQARDESYLHQAGLEEREAAALASCAEWTAVYPSRHGNPSRRRIESTCPLLAPSVAAGAIRYAVDRIDKDDAPESIDALIRRQVDAFLRMESEADPRLRCLVVVIPELDGSKLLEATDPARPIRGELLRQGVFLGEFFPSRSFAASIRPRLQALWSPAPMLVLRPFLESDWRVVSRVPEWRATYLSLFGEPPAYLQPLGGFWQRLRWRRNASDLDLAGVEENPGV